MIQIDTDFNEVRLLKKVLQNPGPSRRQEKFLNFSD